MKFRVERDALADAVAWAAGACPPGPGAGARRCAARRVGRRRPADGLRLRLRGLRPRRARRDHGDPGRGAGLRPAARRDHPGAAGQAGRRRPSTAPASTIICGSGRFTLPTMPVEDYPPLPAMPEVAGTVDGASSSPQAVAQVAVAAGRDDTLPMLTGIRVEIDGARLTLAATDRYRLAVRELAWRAGGRRRCPPRCSSRPARWPRPPRRSAGAGQVELALSGAATGMIGFAGGGRRTTTRLLDARVPAVPLAAPDRAHQRQPSRGRAAGRGGQAGRAGRRPRTRRCGWSSATTGCVLAAGGDDGGQRRGGAALRARRRAADHRVQPRVPARRARRAATPQRARCRSPRRPGPR